MPEPQVYARNPAIRGEQIVFVADDDLWSVPATGGVARRLTADATPASSPWLSPDGSLVAYVSRREGPAEVIVTGAGSPAEPRRLTWWGGSVGRVLGWLDDGRVLATSSIGQAFRRMQWAWALPLDGGPPTRMLWGPVTGMAIGPGGATLLGVHQSRFAGAAWKRYRGGTAPKIWIDRDGSGQFSLFAPELDGQLEDPGWCQGRVVFVSDHEGYGNIYSAAPSGDDLRRHTDHGDFYARAAATDGRRVVYQCAGDLWVLDELTADSQPRRLELQLGSAVVGRRRRPLAAADHVGDLAVDHSGRASALEVQGALAWVTHRDGPAPVLSAGGPVRARLPVVLGQRGVVAWVTDADGDDAIEVRPIEVHPTEDGDSRPARRFGAGQLGRILELRAAPDGRHLALATHDGRVLLADPDAGTWREIERSASGAASGLAWSPDSAWLAWSHAGPAPWVGSGDTVIRQIRMTPVGDGAGPAGSVVEVTPLRFDDHDPAFSRDGKYLAFLSARTFDPVYDEHIFDMGFVTATRAYLLPLAATTASPMEPEAAGRAPAWLTPEPPGARAVPAPAPAAPAAPAASAGSPEAPAGSSAEAPDGSSAEAPAGDAPGPVEVKVDLDGLADRVVPIPVAAGDYRDLAAAHDGLLWLAAPLGGQLGEDRSSPTADPAKPRLVRFDLDKRRELTLREGVDAFAVSGDGRSVVVKDKDGLRVVPADKPAADNGQDGDGDNDDQIDVDLSRLRLHVDPPARWRQMYDETARLMRDHFWVADMSGVDWDAAAARYRPLLERIATRGDLSELLWELNGELGTSHAYELREPPAVDDALAQGWLGTDLSRQDDGTWQVDAVLTAETSVPAARSPLRAPGAAVDAGQRIVAVDGTPVGPDGVAPLLAGSVDRPVQLTVQAGDRQRTVVVVPTGDETPLRYYAWVAANRAAVHAASDGRVGYLHIPNMVARGWADLHRDLRIELTREALVVDVRDNGGGPLSELVLEKLSRTVTAWNIVRHAQPSTYPFDAPRGPMVAIINEYAGSDGDIFSAGFRRRHLGPLVGTRTWGGVIGIDGRYQLVDGTTVTQPRYAFWFDDTGWAVENHGVDPDVEVHRPPQDWAAGIDQQLDTAVRLVLDELTRRPAATPPDPATRPSRAAPVLPPRS